MGLDEPDRAIGFHLLPIRDDGRGIDLDAWRRTVARGYSPSRFCEWVKLSPEFSGAYEKAMAVQESRLVSKGLEGKGQAMAIFILKNNHGWRDKQEIEQTSLNVDVDLESVDPHEARGRLQRLMMRMAWPPAKPILTVSLPCRRCDRRRSSSVSAPW